MIRYRFGPEDLGRVRFAISPLTDLVASFEILREPARHPLHEPWAREARERAKALDLTLLDLVVPDRAYKPDFVSPPPTKPVASFEEELARVAATPREQVALELSWAYPRGLPPAAAALVEELEPLLATMLAYWRATLAPHWPAVKATLEADVAARAAQLAAGGPLAALGDLHPDIAYGAGELRVERVWEETVELAGRGLLLVPSAFAWPRVWTMIDPPWRPAIVYPARGTALLWAPQLEDDEALADLLGRRRARLLRALPATTHELARQLRASPGGVSEHLGVLRRAGLIEGRREGRAVRYVRTAKGDSLIA